MLEFAHVRVASSSWFTTQCEAFQSHSALFIVSLLLQTKAMSAWEKCLEAAKIPEPARAKLLELGFDTQEAFSFKDEKVFEVFAKDFLLVDLKLDGATETNWACKPLVQKLRALWMKGCGGGAAPQALALPYTPVVVGACPGSGLLLGSNKGLTVADRDQLRRALEAKYTGCVVDLESLPSMPFLNIVKTQHDNKAWDWLPWKKVLSEKVASALKGKKPALGPLEVLCGANVEEQLDRELSNQPFPILQLLTVRGHAYAMVGSGHLGSWTLYNNRFMKFYTQVPGPHLRFCSAQEAEEADQAAMREVFNLCYAGSSIDDALHSIAVDRDMLRSLLMPRPKLEKLFSREPLARKRPTAPATGPSKRLRNGECFKWRLGECKLKNCRFAHACAACGATDHHAEICKEASADHRKIPKTKPRGGKFE
jgi:hypothetical protein